MFTSDKLKDGRVRERRRREVAGVVRRRHHCVAKRLAPHANFPKLVRRLSRRCTTRSWFRSKTARRDQTILRHIRSLARLTDAKLMLLHVADGWAARNYERFKLQESEEMKQDREYLAALSARTRAEGYQVKTVLAMGDPATEIIRLARRRGDRSDRDDNARPPAAGRFASRQHRRQGPASGRRAGAASKGEKMSHALRAWMRSV